MRFLWILICAPLYIVSGENYVSNEIVFDRVIQYEGVTIKYERSVKVIDYHERDVRNETNVYLNKIN